MKKCFICLLSIVLLSMLLLAGCGGNDKPDPTSPTTPTYDPNLLPTGDSGDIVIPLDPNVNIYE